MQRETDAQSERSRAGDLPRLTLKEGKFCDRIVAGDNGVTAARTAGYSAKTAVVMASKLLKKGKILKQIGTLKRLAVAGVIAPGSQHVVLSRQYLIQRLVEIQHDQRDSVALRAIEMLGREEFQMFVERVAMVDPRTSSTEELMAMRQRISRRLGLSVSP